jgi:hypothetical protein
MATKAVMMAMATKVAMAGKMADAVLGKAENLKSRPNPNRRLAANRREAQGDGLEVSRNALRSKSVTVIKSRTIY